MMTKHYTIEQAAPLEETTPKALARQLQRDAHKEPRLRKYPHAKKTSCIKCGGVWEIPKKDMSANKKARYRN